MPDRFGATPDAWHHYATTLGLAADLLPVVSNPNATISPNSTLRSLGKTPSRYNQNREASGIAKWTTHRTETAEIERWAREPDYGIAVQTRRLRALDIDVPDAVLSGQVTRLLAVFGDPLIRFRKDTGKVLMPFWHDAPLSKHVIPVEGGMVEILGDGQQFVAEGHHESGSRYEWLGSDIPTLDEVDFAMLLAELTAIATGPIKIAHRRRANGNGAHIEMDDEVATWLLEHWETYDVGQDSQLFIACPFAAEHTSETGVSSCAYFPAGSGGFATGAFVCLHAHCTGRKQAEFLAGIGFTADQFDDLGASDLSTENSEHVLEGENNHQQLSDTSASLSKERKDRQLQLAEERWPKLSRIAGGKIEPTMDNLLTVVATPFLIERHLAFDSFKDEIIWAPYVRGEAPKDHAQWRAMRDTDYPRIRQQLELRGFKPFAQDHLRGAIMTVAEQYAIDTAGEWLRRLSWDGVARLEGFAARGWGWAPSPYAEAVGRYVWTALAGRVLSPGCQADMAPILIGPQGVRKTSAIKAMVPDPAFYAEINLADRDDNTSRKMRGALVAELEELRGLNSRAQEDILAFISRTHESWVPKFREFSHTFARRLIFFGSGNEVEILNNPNGERRWLPGKCLGNPDPDWIHAMRDQLWAEGAARFAIDGIDWQDAERLARDEHGAFKISDAWEPYVRRWLNAEDSLAGSPLDKGHVTTGEALAGALGIPAHQINRTSEIRIGKVLRTIGLERERVRHEGEPVWAYAMP